jgi:hypothetical protein
MSALLVIIQPVATGILSRHTTVVEKLPIIHILEVNVESTSTISKPGGNYRYTALNDGDTFWEMRR